MMRRALGIALVAALAAAGCTPKADGPGEPDLTIYSGRSEELVGPIIERFEEVSDVTVEVRYGDTAELASVILEEGENTPADVFFAQDAGALGALAAEGVFEVLPEDLLNQVPEQFRSEDGRWVGTSGRARVIAFNPDLVSENEVPDTVDELTASRWNGVVGWAPTNSSFQAFVTAYRIVRGEEAARAWLEGMKANRAQEYPDNDTIAEAIAEGEVEVGLVNHYYPFEVREEIPDANVEAHFLTDGDPGGLINVAGAGIIFSQSGLAEEFVEFLLSDEAQEYFVEETWEYPLVASVDPYEGLPPLDELEAPEIDLDSLADLEGTLNLLADVGLT